MEMTRTVGAQAGPAQGIMPPPRPTYSTSLHPEEGSVKTDQISEEPGWPRAHLQL